MAKPKKATNSQDIVEHIFVDVHKEQLQRPRLHKLTIRNFRCIGPTPVEIELDDIVVLVGANNSGKSSILRAYELVMEQGSKKGLLSQDDAHCGVFKEGHYPEIELETVVYKDRTPAAQWVRTDPKTGEMFVREKWTWQCPGPAKKVGFDVQAGDWHADSGPWGTANVSKVARPEPHRIQAFDSPENQAEQIIELLSTALMERVERLGKSTEDGAVAKEKPIYQQLLSNIKDIQKRIVEDATTEITRIEKEIGDIVKEVFPDYEIKFNARPEDDIDKAIKLFKATPQLLMGPSNHHQSPLEKQGSGARRTLMWAALRILAEEHKGKADTTKERAHLLLIDEPELCLHPDAVRDACRVLYDLPKGGAWQVMVTTHSPVFLDLARDNTSIVRVERQDHAIIKGTTIYRPKKAALDADDRTMLKMLNVCDPYVAEFFFGGKTIIVEGDAEYAALKYVISISTDERFRNLHIVRARGKTCIVTLCKILNQFGVDYSVLHDSDKEKIISRKEKKEMTNPAWTVNQRILEAVESRPKGTRVRLVAIVPNLEEAFFDEEAKDEKPYEAIVKLSSTDSALKSIQALLEGLLDHGKALPPGTVEWNNLAVLKAAVEQLPVSTTS